MYDPFQVDGSASGIIMTQIDAAQRAITKIIGILKNDHYATLMCDKFAPAKIVRKAYLQLARKSVLQHPS